MDTIDSVLTAADRAWRAYGVLSADRAALAADLRADLEAAAAEGAEPRQLIGSDVAGFARRLADEAGVVRSHPEYARLFGTALVGAALGAVLGYAASTMLDPLLDPVATDAVPVQVAVGVFYGIPAAVVVAAAVITVLVQMREAAGIRRTATAMAVLWPLTGLLITPVVMGFAWTTGYSTASPVVITEIGMVVAALIGATYLARRWALREPRTGAEVPPRSATGPSPA